MQEGRRTGGARVSKPSGIPYLHVRPPKRVVVGGGGDHPVAKLYANRAGLLRLREQIDRALAAEEGMAAGDRYREIDEAEFDLVVFRAPNRKQMGEGRIGRIGRCSLRACANRSWAAWRKFSAAHG